MRGAATPTQAEHSEGGLVGLLIGDTLSVPCEFHDTGEIPLQQWIACVPRVLVMTAGNYAGGIAGIRDGITAIPHRWRSALRGRDLYEPLLHQLLDLQLRQQAM